MVHSLVLKFLLLTLKNFSLYLNSFLIIYNRKFWKSPLNSQLLRNVISTHSSGFFKYSNSKNSFAKIQCCFHYSLSYSKAWYSFCNSVNSSSSLGKYNLYFEVKICVSFSCNLYLTTDSLLSAHSTIPIGEYLSYSSIHVHSNVHTSSSAPYPDMLNLQFLNQLNTKHFKM